DGTVLHVDQKLMQMALQYGLSEGMGELREWLIAFQKRMHAPPTLLDSQHPGRFDLVLTNGANEAIALCFGLLLDQGDYALCEAATYATAMSMMPPIGAAFYGVKSDDQGIDPEDLERILSTWSTVKPGTKKPKVLYAITSGGNPTGVTWSLERKRAVYQVARSHDLIILEDDAYYFLQFSRPLVPTFLSMDVDGRILRLDTFSKVVAPGLRVGVVSGPQPILQKMRQQKDCLSVHPSGLSQVLLLQLLKHWGQDGLLDHADELKDFYKKKADTAVQSATKYLAGLAEWVPPTGGFFLWMRVLGVKDASEIVDKALERRVIVVAGCHFLPSNPKSPYIRLNFALAADEEIEEAFRILGDIIRDECKK
ncbi:hypothetical protein BaRGS_00016772, partial [Batillaria attramentaria]